MRAEAPARDNVIRPHFGMRTALNSPAATQQAPALAAVGVLLGANEPGRLPVLPPQGHALHALIQCIV